MRKFMQFVGVALGFVTMFVFAILQIHIWQNYGFILGILTWLPFVGTLWLLGQLFPFGD